MASAANEPAKYLILVHTVQLKPMIKAQISGIMVSNGISDVATASVYSEKTLLKKLLMIMKMIIPLNETEARKVMVDFKFDRVSRKLNQKFVLVGGAV